MIGRIPSAFAVNSFSYRKYSFGYFLDSCLRLGVDRIELCGCHPHFTPFEAEPFDVKALAAQIRSRGLTVAAILPEQNFLPVNIASEDEYFRKKSVEQIAFYLRAAGELDCHMVTVYPGKCRKDQPPSLAWNKARDSIDQLKNIAAQNGAELLLEPVSPFVSSLMPDISALQRMIDGVGGGVGVCLNSSAAALAGESLDDYFRTFGERIRLVQLSDSCEENEQMVIGQGTQDFKQHCADLKKHGYRGDVVIELMDEELADRPEASYAESLSCLQKIWEEPA
ncbi:MAG: sugar phosphate isomerase/epimerase [Eubacteriales bacterium]|nr:sugar phosphate isomerase/epimerase [Eubacteriales bacterium]